MSYTPVEVRHVRLKKGFFGYRRQLVDRVLEDVTASFETVWRERADLTDKVEQLESDLVRFQELDGLLRTTLVSAERAAHELKDQAKREAEVIVAEAQAEARMITRKARSERELLTSEAKRLRLLLHAALDALDEADDEEAEQVPDAGPEAHEGQARAA